MDVVIATPEAADDDDIACGVALPPATDATLGASEAADLSPKTLNDLTLCADVLSLSSPSSDGDDKAPSNDKGAAADGLGGGYCSRLMIEYRKEEPVCTCYFFSRFWALPRRRCPLHRRKRDRFYPTGVGAGLENLGNTCFMNSILQCFTHTVPLVKALRSFSHEEPCGGKEFCVVCTLHEHVELCVGNSGKIVEPHKFCNNLSNICSYFSKGQQEDAHEFLQCFFDKLESSSLQSTSSATSSATKANNVVDQIFGGRLVSKLLCSNCGHCSENFEPLNGMSMGIEDADTLEDVLESFTEVEKLEDTTCENCKEKVTKDKQLMLDKTPPVAALHLKRFRSDGFFVEKIHKHVKFPLELDLKPYTIDHRDSNANMKYQLYGFVVHRGYMPTGGHYFCYIRPSPDKWHRLDDEMVREVEEKEVLSEEAYILFYAREGTPWFSSLLELQKLCPELSNLAPSPKSVLDNTNDGKHTVSPDTSGADNSDTKTTEEVIESTSMNFLGNMEYEGCSTSETMDDAAENGAGIFVAVDQLGHNCNEFNIDTPAADVVVPERETDRCSGVEMTELFSSPPVLNDSNEAHINLDSRNGGHSPTPVTMWSPGSYSGRVPGFRHTLPPEHMTTENRVVNRGSRSVPAMSLSSRRMMLLAAIICRRYDKRRPKPSPRKMTISPISCTKLHMRPYYSLRRKLARRIGFSGQ